MAMAARGGRGDDGGVISEMDWTVVRWQLCVSTDGLDNGNGSARLALAGEGEAERERE